MATLARGPGAPGEPHPYVCCHDLVGTGSVARCGEPRPIVGLVTRIPSPCDRMPPLYPHQRFPTISCSPLVTAALQSRVRVLKGPQSYSDSNLMLTSTAGDVHSVSADSCATASRREGASSDTLQAGNSCVLTLTVSPSAAHLRQNPQLCMPATASAAPFSPKQCTVVLNICQQTLRGGAPGAYPYIQSKDHPDWLCSLQINETQALLHQQRSFNRSQQDPYPDRQNSTQRDLNRCKTSRCPPPRYHPFGCSQAIPPAHRLLCSLICCSYLRWGTLALPCCLSQ